MKQVVPVLWLVSVFTSCATAASPPTADLLFAHRILPLLKARCFACHGADPNQLRAEFDMRSRAGLLRGGASGDPAVVPGQPAASPLYQAVAGVAVDQWPAMPPKANDRLSRAQVASIATWISAGAPWPDTPRLATLLKQPNPWADEDGVQVKTSGGLSAGWTNRTYAPQDLWSWKPIQRPPLPDQAGHPIDRLLHIALPENLAPAPPADRLALIRRATFDLLGLPPTPAEIDDFLEDPRPGAFARLITRLLASPHYGEQWGRHWLDVVRYADSAGFANDFERPNAWRYRDYVIRAFNQDKPYDEFVREQIAGDELTAGQTGTPRVEALIAAGFLRMGPWEQTGMEVARLTRQQFLDDVTNSVGQVFLGHVLRCARCHDHKFDPIPTRDYYALQAVFANTQFAEVDAAFLPSENITNFSAHRKYHRLRQDNNKRLLESLPKQQVTPNDFGRTRLGRKWRTLFRWGADRYQPIAFTVYNGPTRLRFQVTLRQRRPKETAPANATGEQTTILTGGDVFAPAEQVQPGALTATGLNAEIPATLAGRRTALAHWLTRRDHPLTARVMANRVWQYHFGRGLAGNPNNFGTAGEKPTHPELLDWLAAEFIANGWSVKRLHQLIMTSQTYQRASAHPDPATLAQLDSAARSYAVFRPRRLAAEELRDAMLAVSGELNRQPGGIPARPDINLEAALQPRMIMGTFAPSYVPDPQPSQRNRRSIYALKLRGQRDPFMTTFNQPGTDDSCERRDASNVTPQVLTLLNSQESADRALAFAARLINTTTGAAETVRQAFRLALGRPPDAAETAAALRHWQDATAEQQDRTPQPHVYPREITRRANEENTGATFTFTETLYEYQDYQPDLQPHQVAARTRGLADLCLVLFNTNEFIYID